MSETQGRAYARTQRSNITHIVVPESTQTRCGQGTYEMARWWVAPGRAPVRGVCRACEKAS